jgi:hypothetical protein
MVNLQHLQDTPLALHVRFPRTTSLAPNAQYLGPDSEPVKQLLDSRAN